MATIDEEEEKRRKSLLERAKQFGSDVLTAPARLGEAIGERVGQQKYGTGISAEGDITGRPYAPESMAGKAAEATATGLETVGQGLESIGQFAPALTGNGGLPEKPQVASSALDGAAPQTVTAQIPPAGTLPAGAPQQAQPLAGSPQANFEMAKATGQLTPEKVAEAQKFAQKIGTTFSPETGYDRTPFLQSQAPQGLASGAAPQGGRTFNIDETKARLGGMTLNQFTNAPAGTPGVNGMRTDAQGRMIPSFAEQSMAREARAEETFGIPRGREEGGGEVVGRVRRDRGAGEMSMAQATRLAGGDREKARQLIEQQRLGVGPFKGAAEMTPAEREAQMLDLERKRQIVEQGKNPKATPEQKRAAEIQQAVDDGLITEAEAIEARRRSVLGFDPTFANLGGEQLVQGEQPAQVAAQLSPKSGEVRNGFRFKGGDPKKKENWEKV